MSRRERKDIIGRYLKGECTEAEKALAEAWYDDFVNQQRQQANPAPHISEAQQAVWASLQAQIGRQNNNITLSRIFYYAAAAILIIGGIGFYFFNQLSLNQTDALPGGNRATLTLADGKKINLDSAKFGILISDENMQYNDGTKINGSIHLSSAITYNTLSTPKGGQYQIILSDGTKVWLNAATTLTYPTSFKGQNQRLVKVTGEAYFEIAENKTQSFRVATSKQTIEVIGTHFNVNSYQDEPEEKTTLLEGAVKVTSGTDSKLLAPGQQAAIEDEIKVSKADLKATLAWKNGKFVFNDESLESIMRKVSRWYNVEVEYDGADRKETYWGSFSRFDKVSSVLKKLELAGGIHFKMEEGRIIAMK